MRSCSRDAASARRASAPASCLTSCPRRRIREGDWRIAPFPDEIADRRVEITGPGRPQDGDQRAELGREGVHGRLRGRELPRPGRTASRAGEPDRRLERTIELVTPEKEYRLNEGSRRCSCGRAAGICRAALRGRRRADRRRPSSTSACTCSATTAATGGYFYLPKLESTSRRGSGTTSSCGRRTARRAPRHDQGHRPDRDDPRRLRDGRDPLRAAGPRRRTQRRPVGLHLLGDQEVPASAGVRPPRPRRRDDDRPVHARVRELLVKTCHRRGAHAMGGMAAFIPIPPRPGGQRSSPREGARGQGARGGSGLRRHLGRAPRPRAGRAGGVRRRARRPAEPDRPTARRRRGGRCDLLDVASTPGAVTEEGLRNNVSVGIQYLAAWLRGSARSRSST